MARKLLVAIGLMMCGIGFTGIPAEALAWYGFSDLCLVGTWKGGKAGELEITLQDLTVATRCENTQSGQYCQPGSGNAGAFVILDIPTILTDKATGTVSTGYVCLGADLGLPLSKFDDHSAPDHIHTCQPLTNDNKIEIPGTAYVPKIVNSWVLKDSNGKVIRKGFQTCVWRGDFLTPTAEDPTQCRPEHGGIDALVVNEIPDSPEGFGDYDCPINTESRK